MKRILAVFTAALIMLSFGGCAGDTKKDTASQDETVLKFTEQWKMYLTAQENLYSAEKAAYEKALVFYNEKTWDSLTDAAVTAAAAADCLSGFDGFEIILTDDEFTYLLDKGLDVSFVPTVFKEFDTLYENEAAICKGLFGRLAESVYTEEELELFGSIVENKLDEIECMSDYACAETSYVALDINDAALAEELKEHITKNCPALAEGMDSWGSSADDAMNKADEAMDELEDIISASSNIVGQEEGITEAYAEIIKYPAEISGMPELLPMPQWYNAMDAQVSYMISDGKETVKSCDEDVLDKVTGCAISIDGADGEAVAQYIDMLKSEGCRVIGEKDESTTFGVDNYAAEIGFDGERAYVNIVGEKLCFAPTWYLDRAR